MVVSLVKQILFCCCAIYFVQSQSIIEIHTKTLYPMDEQFGNLDVEITNGAGQTCYLYDLDEPGW